MTTIRKTWRIPRRTFLRGAGAFLGLPLLEAMGSVLPEASPSAAASTTAASNVQAPVRMACLYFPNGVWEADWFPKTGGSEYESTPGLAPLADLREHCLVFSGLEKANSYGGDGHYAKTANFLTGMPVRQTTGKDISVGGISIDQLCAQELGHLTPLPSLELGVDPVISGIDTNVGYTRLYGSYISWRSPSIPVAREINPQLAYKRLFGALNGGNLSDDERQKTQDDKALLDLVLEDAKSLRRKLGRDDQFKFDEYLDSVREVEKRIQFFANPDTRGWRPEHIPNAEDMAAAIGEPGDHQEHVRLMLDLIVLAFQTDCTRVSSFMFANDVSGKNFSALVPGANGSHHEFSHHQNKEEKYGPYSKINQWHTAQLAYMLNKMASIKEGERTLLDNSMIFFGSSLSDGNRHDPKNLPIVLAGHAGGKVGGGRHIQQPAGTPLCNLYVPMLESMGVKVDAFGDSNGPLYIA